MLRVGPRHRVQNAEAAYGIGDHRQSRALHPGVAIGGVARVQLIAVANPGDGAGHQVIQKVRV